MRKGSEREGKKEREGVAEENKTKIKIFFITRRYGRSFWGSQIFGYPRSVPIHKLKIVLFGFKFKLKEKRSESKTDFESQVKFELYK